MGLFILLQLNITKKFIIYATVEWISKEKNMIFVSKNNIIFHSYQWCSFLWRSIFCPTCERFQHFNFGSTQIIIFQCFFIIWRERKKLCKTLRTPAHDTKFFFYRFQSHQLHFWAPFVRRLPFTRSWSIFQGKEFHHSKKERGIDSVKHANWLLCRIGAQW